MSSKLADDFLVLQGSEATDVVPGSATDWLTLAIANDKNTLSLTIIDGENIYVGAGAVATETTANGDILTISFAMTGGIATQIVSWHRSYLGSPNIIHMVDFTETTQQGWIQLNFWNGYDYVRSSGWRLSG